MKISNVILASMVSAGLFVNCKNDSKLKNKTSSDIEKTKQDSLKKAKIEMNETEKNCPACGMG